MKLTGGVFGVLSSNASVAATTIQDGRPPLRGPYADEDWVEYRAVPGNTAAVAAAPDLDPNALEGSTFYDGDYISDQCAIVGDTMYIAGGGHVRALDAHDGSIRWTSEAVGASSSPAAAYDRIVATGGDGPVVALDIADGTLEWETTLDGVISTPTVAYETVYVVAGGILYALDVTDGSINWERRPETDSAAFLNRPPAASDGQVYAIVDPEEGDNELVAIDAATGDRRWGDEWHYVSTPAATEVHVAAATGLGDERFRALEATSGDAVFQGQALTVPALDDEVALTVLDWKLEATFFDEREGWELSNFSTGAVSEPTLAGDTVYVYVGRDHQEAYSHSLLAIDKQTGDVEWTVDVPASDEGLGISVVPTADGIYVFEQDEIHVVREQDASGGEDGTDGDDSSTPEDDSSTPEGDSSTPEDDSSTPDEDPSTPEDDSSTPEDDSATPEATSTPEEPTETDCDCPGDSSTDYSSPRDESSPTDPATATDADTVSNDSNRSTGEDPQAVEDAPSPEGTDGAGPGLGIASAVGSLGGIGYVLRRRLGGDEPEEEH